MLATRLGHGCDQFAVGQTNEGDHQSTDCKSDQRSGRTGFADPLPGQQNPTLADHGAKSQGENLAVFQNLYETLG